jgi:general secretion pathway protein K
MNNAAPNTAAPNTAPPNNAAPNTAVPRHRAKSGNDGFIIVAVLWILAALATLVSVYAIYVTNTAIAVTTSGDAIIADPLVAAGVELAAYQLLGKPDDKAQVDPTKRPGTGRFTARLGAARLSVAFQTEAARIDINEAPKELLTGLLVSFGASPLDAGEFADHIIAWRTPANAQNANTDPESSRYLAAGLSYTPRHARFAHVDELWLLQGIPSVLIERMLPFVTVYSGKPQVDIIDAAPQVIAALPGMNPEVVQSLVAARAAGALDKTTLPGLLGGTGQSAAGTDPGNTYRVGVRIDFDNGRRSAAEAVILLPDDGPVPYRVLSWRNAFDGATDQPMDFGRR